MIPQRQCVCCRKYFPRTELIRILKEHKAQKLYIQPCSRIQGRSAYICYNKSCIETALKKGKLQKALHTKLNNQITEMLQRMVK